MKLFNTLRDHDAYDWKASCNNLKSNKLVKWNQWVVEKIATLNQLKKENVLISAVFPSILIYNTSPQCREMVVGETVMLII